MWSASAWSFSPSRLPTSTGHERSAGTVVTDAVRPQIRLRHNVDLVFGNDPICRRADEELMPDHMGAAALRIAALDRELVVAGGQSAECDRLFAGGQEFSSVHVALAWQKRVPRLSANASIRA